MANVIEATQVVKRYGTVEAVAGVDLQVAPGELFGLIGHNGAGKSTLFKMMLGLIPPTSGEILIDGQPVYGERFRRVRRSMGYLPENVVFYDNLSGLETLAFFARLKGVSTDTCRALLDTVGLTHAIDRPVRGYSKGMRQRLGFAQALLGKPKLLLLDEPTTGLDPDGIHEFYQRLDALRRDGVTIILTSHILSEIQARVDRLAIMRNGRIDAVGTLASLRNAMALPLRLELRVADERLPELHALFAGAYGVQLALTSDGASLQCERDAKMTVLQRLASLNGLVTDIQIHEPSLEDVFHGRLEKPHVCN